jgi:hypothetical protein
MISMILREDSMGLSCDGIRMGLQCFLMDLKVSNSIKFWGFNKIDIYCPASLVFFCFFFQIADTWLGIFHIK